MTPRAAMTRRRMRRPTDARRAAARRSRRAQTARRGRSAAASELLARRTPGELDVAHGAILYLDDITVSFDGFKALNDADARRSSAGELRCIIGPNGAGKTTMMDVITGKTRPDAGKAFFGSTIDLLRLRETEIARVGHRPQVPEADGLRAPHACSRTSSSR